MRRRRPPFDLSLILLMARCTSWLAFPDHKTLVSAFEILYTVPNPYTRGEILHLAVWRDSSRCRLAYPAAELLPADYRSTDRQERPAPQGCQGPAVRDRRCAIDGRARHLPRTRTVAGGTWEGCSPTVSYARLGPAKSRADPSRAMVAKSTACTYGRRASRSASACRFRLVKRSPASAGRAARAGTRFAW